MFHIPDGPEYYGAKKYPGQIWVLWCCESSVNYPRISNQRFLGRFDLVMTYQQRADIWCPYLPSEKFWVETKSRPIVEKTESAPVVMFQSSNINKSGRQSYIQGLSKHIQIDSYGRFLNNRKVVGPDSGHQTKNNTIQKHRFCIAFENSITVDYVTEKLYDPLRAGTVPIYLGAPNVSEFAPEYSYIDAIDYNDPAKLAEYLHHLVNSPTEYEAYFAWRSKPLPAVLLSKLEILRTPTYARLMQAVAERAGKNIRPQSSGPRYPFGAINAANLRLRTIRRGVRAAIKRNRTKAG